MVTTMKIIKIKRLMKGFRTLRIEFDRHVILELSAYVTLKNVVCKESNILYSIFRKYYLIFENKALNYKV